MSDNSVNEESSSNPQCVDIDLYADIEEFKLPSVLVDENDCLSPCVYDDLTSASSPHRRYGFAHKDTPRPNRISGPSGRICFDKDADYDSDNESSFLHRPEPTHQIFVGNLTWWTTDIDISETLTQIGVTDLVNIKFFESRINGLSKGFCTLTVGSEASVTLIKESLAKQLLRGQVPQVLPATKNCLNQLEYLATQRSAQPANGIKPMQGVVVAIETIVTSRVTVGPSTSVRGGNVNTANTPMGPPNYDLGRGAGASGVWSRGPNGPSPRGVSPQNSFSRAPFQHGRHGRGIGIPPHPMMYGGGVRYGPGSAQVGMGYGRGQMPRGNLDHLGMFPPMDWICRPPPIPMPQFPGFLPPRPHMNPAFLQNLRTSPPRSSSTFNSPPVRSTAFNSPPGTSRAFKSSPVSSTAFDSPPGISRAFNSPSGTSTPLNSSPGSSTAFNSPPGTLHPPGLYSPPRQMQMAMEQLGDQNDTPPPGNSVAQSEFEEVMSRNQAVSTSALNRAGSDIALGDLDSAVDTLHTAITLIRHSKVAQSYRCKVLLGSLEDALRGIEQKSIQMGMEEFHRSVGHERERENRSHGRKRSRSPYRRRERSYSGDRHRRRRSADERGREYRERPRYENDRAPPERRYREHYHASRYGEEREIENGRCHSSRHERLDGSPYLVRR